MQGSGAPTGTKAPAAANGVKRSGSGDDDPAGNTDEAAALRAQLQDATLRADAAEHQLKEARLQLARERDEAFVRQRAAERTVESHRLAAGGASRDIAEARRLQHEAEKALSDERETVARLRNQVGELER